jgi:hypothetical protein
MTASHLSLIVLIFLQENFFSSSGIPFNSAAPDDNIDVIAGKNQ